MWTMKKTTGNNGTRKLVLPPLGAPPSPLRRKLRRLRKKIEESGVKLLTPAGDAALPPVLDQIKVEAGYEMALAAALGDDLDAPLSGEAPRHWR